MGVSADIKVFNNVVAAGEVGSGTFGAASGQHFSSITPSGETASPGTLLDGFAPHWIEGVSFPPRSHQGQVDLREDKIIQAIHDQMNGSSTSVSVLHLVYGSKTGLVYPRWEKVQTLMMSYPKRLVVVVDACQFRCDFSELSRFVESGCLVMFTGSKYYCGPPFSGGVLLPPQAVQTIEKSLEDEHAPLPRGITSYLSYHQVSSGMPNLRKRLSELKPNFANVGLYLRWCVALNTMEAHSKLSAQQIVNYQENWIISIRSLLSQHREYLSELKEEKEEGNEVMRVEGIVCVVLSVEDRSSSTRKRQLTMEECRVFHRLMTLDLSNSSTTLNTPSDASLAQLLATLVTPSEGITLSSRALIGQPVSLSSGGQQAVVRLALGADLLLRINGGELIEVTSEDIKVVSKMALLLKHWKRISEHLTQAKASAVAQVVVSSTSPSLLSADRMAAVDSTLNVTTVVDLESSRLTQAETISSVLQKHCNTLQLPDVSVILDLIALDRNISQATSAFSRLSLRYSTRHCFAVKSCPLTYLLHYMVNHRGTGLECASLCEVQQALRVGCEPLYVIFDCPCKSVEDIAFALSHHVTLNANSYAELDKIEKCLDRLKSEGVASKSVIGLRVNPMVGGGANAALSTATATSKFGIPLLSCETNDLTPASELLLVKDFTEQIVQAYVDHPFLSAVMCHVGSQGMPLRLMSLGAKRILDLADLIDQRCGPARIKMVDIGGGITANYDSDEVTPSFGDYVDDLLAVCPSLSNSNTSGGSGRILITEFGKGLIAKCGYVTSRIEDVLQSPANAAGSPPSVVAIGHAGADLLLRTAYCPSKFAHRVVLLDEKKRLLTCNSASDGSSSSSSSSSRVERAAGCVTIAGPLCFSGDIVASNLANFPLPVAGDICVVLDAGANTLSLFSRHCSRKRPRVFAFRGDHMGMISEGEAEEDVLRFWD